MKQLVRRHLGLIIFLIIALIFPLSLSNQVKLNMRVIVTGIAIDKVGDEFEITAQIVNASPGSESPGQSAELNFLTDKGETVSKALANLMYKTGKVSAFSHTSFIILGNDILKEDATKCLDVFMRDKIIKNSALLLIAKDKAKDELKKTKNLELSVGLGLQKVYIFKQEESDGLMLTILGFLNKSKMYGKTAVVSQIELENNEKSDDSAENSSKNTSSSSSGSSSLDESGSSDSQGNSGSSSQSNGEESSGSSSGGSGSSGEQKNNFSFKAGATLKCFVDGKYVLDLSEEDDVLGYMLSANRTKTTYIEIEDVEIERFEDARFSISINDKDIYKKIRFENGTPCLDMKIVVNNAQINDILASEIVTDISKDEFEKIKDKLEKSISKMVSSTFEKTKSVGADIFRAYEKAYKFNYNDLNKYKISEDDFIKKLRLNLEICITKLEY